MYVAVICDRNLSAELEEPKSAIEGLEGLALEYSWQELQQAPIFHPGHTWLYIEHDTVVTVVMMYV